MRAAVAASGALDDGALIYLGLTGDPARFWFPGENHWIFTTWDGDRRSLGRALDGRQLALSVVPAEDPAPLTASPFAHDWFGRGRRGETYAAMKDVRSTWSRALAGFRPLVDVPTPLTVDFTGPRAGGIYHRQDRLTHSGKDPVRGCCSPVPTPARSASGRRHGSLRAERANRPVASWGRLQTGEGPSRPDRRDKPLGARRATRDLSTRASARAGGVLDEDGERQHAEQPHHRDDGLHDRPRLDGLPRRSGRNTPDQPEAGVVDVAEEQRAGADGQDEQGQHRLVEGRGELRDDAGGSDCRDRGRQWPGGCRRRPSQPSRRGERPEPWARSPITRPTPASTSICLKPPPAATMSRIPAMGGSEAPMVFSIASCSGRCRT